MRIWAFYKTFRWVLIFVSPFFSPRCFACTLKCKGVVSSKLGKYSDFCKAEVLVFCTFLCQRYAACSVVPYVIKNSASVIKRRFQTAVLTTEVMIRYEIILFYSITHFINRLGRGIQFFWKILGEENAPCPVWYVCFARVVMR